MGARFALAGGRQGWIRTVLTAVGVGLGVAVLLLAASVPHVLQQRDARGDARSGGVSEEEVKRSSTSVLMGSAFTTFHGRDIEGHTLQAEGKHPKLPPGVEVLPGPGEMVVSPALGKLLDQDGSRELAHRLDGRVVGTIGDEGLLGPGELAVYLGSDQLRPGENAQRFDRFGVPSDKEPLGPALLLIVVVACVVLVLPVAVFIGTAVRFGSERRDQRLAALRLVGADAAMTHRMVAGESLVGAGLGLLLGGGFFLLGRSLVGHIRVFDLSVFPSDVTPAPLIAALIVVGVPVLAVGVAQSAMRALAVEPLGVLREAVPRPRRLWWRLLPPACGLLLLLPLSGRLADAPLTGRFAVSKTQISAGVVLLLSGVALLLPWLVERLVGRLRGGLPSWQLAVRRLQLSSGSATRAVSGITIAVAGAVALQMLFSAADPAAAGERGEREKPAAEAESHGWRDAQLRGAPTQHQVGTLVDALRRTEGVRDAVGFLEVSLSLKSDPAQMASAAVADCATLRRLARIGSCRDGDVFLPPPQDGDEADEDVVTPKPGTRFTLRESGKGAPEWTVPASAREVRATPRAAAESSAGVLATPGAIDADALELPWLNGWVRMDKGRPEVTERVRSAVFRVDPGFSIADPADPEDEVLSKAVDTYDSVRRGIFAGATAVLLLIGASMIVSMLEQLRERRRQLAVLVAFGTRRATLGASVLWQTAVPVLLGLGLAAVFGWGLGWVLLRIIGEPMAGWTSFVPIAGVGAGVIAVVTLASLPALWRLMRPDGLRTE
ncbi:ABC transporter permease [Streptomyces boncukensis]|uniref:ABC transporter permease n=1 Tax=Streptomyces boncukensis TaxID=2711219 RepID=A0A6G4WWH6_9ACTN|nr:ABC transporter permease [Streptomyces boncukensis]NGO69639.1 ABC transporter permease [Streptomyces boncukensis]